MQSDLEQSNIPANGNAESSITAQRHGFRQRFVEEFRRVAVMFVYLWLMFGLFVLNERVILGQRGISFEMQGFALLNALILAKVMMVADYFNAGAWLRRHPLIYRILFDALFLTAVFLCVHILEKVITGLWRGESVAASVPAIGGGGLAGAVCVALILFVSLIPFFGFRSISRELGAAKFNALLFGRPAKSLDLPRPTEIGSKIINSNGDRMDVSHL